ncbi:MAG: DUF2231 domain-containing protein [Myxococcota bacterium]
MTNLAAAAFLLTAFVTLGSGDVGVTAETNEAPADAVEELDSLDEVAAPTAPTLPQVLGRMHSAVVHFPIAWLPLLLLAEWLVLTGRLAHPSLLRPWLLLGTLGAFVPAAMTGLLRLRELPQDAPSLSTALLHRNLMLSAFLLLLLSLPLRVKLARCAVCGRRLYLAALLVATVLVMLGGHLGGRLVFGDAYLPF